MTPIAPETLRIHMRRATFLAILLAFAACGRGKEPEKSAAKEGDSAAALEKEGEPAKGEAPPPVIGAQTAVVATQAFTEKVGAIGNVSARAGHVATLGATSPARVTGVFGTTGERVRTGQTLVTLDSTIFAATARSAAAAVTVAERASERAQRLVAEGISPRRDAEQATADLARARADFLAARRSAELSTLRSPIAGIVTRMTATLGATADPAQTLVEVADPSALDLLLALTPTDARRVRAGAAVTLTSGQQAGGESLGRGTVYDVGGAIDSASRSVLVRVRIANGERPLRIGETVHGEIAVAARPAAIVVPTVSLVPEGDGFKVFVVDEKGVAHAREITVGARADSVAEITKGLTAGERVVTVGAFGVTDGAAIVPLADAGRRISTPEK
ncbi:MAG: efflux RND transporter periplasmic adaptor subunit [Gemmatimonadaceae bacterium]